MWRWRDWVIDAFNRNMPYDQFTIEQLAGDLLPNADAGSANRDRVQSQSPRQFGGRRHRRPSTRSNQVVDRVDTTSTVFLGLTMGCTRCHNHKYDPVTQKEYYRCSRISTMWTSADARADVGNSPPFITAPTPEQQPQLKQLDDELAAAKDAFAKLQPDVAKAQQDWEESLDQTKPLPWGPSRGLVAHYPLDGDLSAQISVSRDGKPSLLTIQDGEARFVPGPVGQAASFDGKRFIQGGDIIGFVEPHRRRPRHRVVRRPVHDGRVDLSHGGERRDSHQGQGGHSRRGCGLGLNLKDGKIAVHLRAAARDASILVRPKRRSA